MRTGTVTIEVGASESGAIDLKGAGNVFGLRITDWEAAGDADMAFEGLDPVTNSWGYILDQDAFEAGTDVLPYTIPDPHTDGASGLNVVDEGMIITPRQDYFLHVQKFRVVALTAGAFTKFTTTNGCEIRWWTIDRIR